MCKYLTLFLLCFNFFPFLTSATNKNIEKRKVHPSILSTLADFGDYQREFPYERFISLGNSCLTRHQIDYHLEMRFGLTKDFFGGGQLFDWVLVEDYHLLAEAFEKNLKRFFEKSDLAYDFDPVYPKVYNTKNKIYWSHLFSRKSFEALVDNAIETEFELRNQKITYLSEKFKALKNYRCLYIISEYQPKFFLSPLEMKKMLIHVRNGLEYMRGNRNFSLLFCCLNPFYKQEIKDFENIYIRILNRNPEEPVGYQDSASWDPILYEFPFTLEKIDWDQTGLDFTYHG